MTLILEVCLHLIQSISLLMSLMSITLHYYAFKYAVYVNQEKCGTFTVPFAN
jgi:hypothetical protein